MVVSQEQYVDLGSSSTSSSSMDTQNMRSGGLRLRHSRSHLLKPDIGKDSKEGENRPRRSSSHSRSSSRSVSTLLILTNERLSLANARNASLEIQKEELLVRFAALANDKGSVEAELQTTREDLRLHKVQLELAQREVNRATEVVRRVDLARAQAETEAARLRSRVRQLESEKVAREGWEEGWDIGFQEGMAQAQTETGLMNRFIHRRSRSSTRRRAGSGASGADGEPDSSTMSSSTKRARSPSIRANPAQNVVPHAPQMPLNIPDIPSQPQQPKSRQPFASHPRERAHSLTSKLRPRSRSVNQRVPPPHPGVDHPEERSSSPEIIRPLPVPIRTTSPTRSHRSVVPPDNYIPMTTREDNFIHLPAPHELMVPIPATPAPSEPETVRGESANGPRPIQAPRSRAMSDVSRVSTRISEYDLVSPPPQERSYGPTNIDPDSSEMFREATEGDPRWTVERWREIVTPPPQGVDPRNTNASEPSRMQPSFAGMRPRSPRVSGGPRQQRQIVKPVPLSTETLLNDNCWETSSSALQAQQHLLRYYPAEQTLQQQQTNVQSRHPFKLTTSEGLPPTGTARAKTPIAWLKKQFQRSYSSPIVPNIEIEPPSQTPTTDSTRDSTRLNPILLSPKDADRQIPLPNDIIADATRGISILPSSTPLPNRPIRIRLPDEELPLGFVPMTPVMSMNNGASLEPDSEPVFSPIPDNYSLPDPFNQSDGSPVQRPATAGGTSKGGSIRKEAESPIMSLGGHWGWASPESARLGRPLSLFSDDD